MSGGANPPNAYMPYYKLKLDTKVIYVQTNPSEHLWRSPSFDDYRWYRIPPIIKERLLSVDKDEYIKNANSH